VAAVERGGLQHRGCCLQLQQQPARPAQQLQSLASLAWMHYSSWMCSLQHLCALSFLLDTLVAHVLLAAC
jgi:hypothetical protein